MHTFGSDFQYMDARMNFMNIDKLVHYIMKNKEKFNVDIKYSTINRYLKTVNKLQLDYETKKDDLFPYAPEDHDYWTGYFTSRTNSKLLVKETGRLLQSLRSYFTMQMMDG
jgi:lysosomal alpha-mannosidase